MTESKIALFKRLAAVQNKIEHQDIMTITAWMDEEQLKKHVEFYEEKTSQSTISLANRATSTAAPKRKGVNAVAWFSRQSFHR